MRTARDVIAALATPPGGALALLRLSGAGALALGRSFLDLGEVAPRRAVLAWARDAGERLDRVLCVFFPEGSSYTGEETLELSAHGSPYVAGRLLELALEAGARLAKPGEFTQRAFLNGRLDLSQAESVCELIAARTRLAHRAALAGTAGERSALLKPLREGLLALRALQEASLDHPEEDIPELPQGELPGRVAELRRRLAVLLAAARRGRFLRAGARVALLGPPNAGKSSLLNALLGRERAIVSELPGTTRDTLEENADLGGLAAVLIDTAGLRETRGDVVEARGMSRSRAALECCDLALLVLDRSRPLAEQEAAAREVLRACARLQKGAVAVLNKADLPSAWEPRALRELSAGDLALLETSATTGSGLEDLSSLLKRELLDAGDAQGAEGAFGVRQEEALRRADAELSAAETASGELAAFHLGAAARALGEITGEDAAQELLDAVFSRFCVGK